MKSKAAVLYGPKQSLQIEEIDVADPKQGEVMVKVAASGVCHSDLHFVDGVLPTMMPIILGHEGAGIVEKVGEGVTHVQPGDHVVMSFVPTCGHCENCVIGKPQLCTTSGSVSLMGGLWDGTSRFSREGARINHFTLVSSFSEYTVVPGGGVVKIREDAPLDRVALVGCGVMTGIGAVVNTAKVPVGSTVAVIGAGGVGLNVIQGAKLAGARKIIVVDRLEHKLGLARDFGATHTVNASEGDPVARVQEITNGGADYAFEVIGLKPTIEQAFAMIKRGGTAVVVGIAPFGTKIEIDPLQFLGEKTLTGSFYGSARPAVDMPRLVDMYMAKQVKLDELVTRKITLEQVNEAFQWLRDGEVARSVIVY